MESTISHFRLIVAERGFAARASRERARRNARARTNLAEATVELPALKAEAFGLGRLTVTLLVAFAVHGAILLVALRAAPERLVQAQNVRVKVIAPSPSVAAAVSPQERAAENLTPVPTPLPKVRAKRKVKPREEPPSAPEQSPVLDVPATPAPVVGLTRDSTSSSGGPAFAVGGTLSGSTAPIAATPGPPVVPVPARPPVPQAPRHPFERTRPKPGTKVEAAQRVSRVEPTYPVELERQGIEGDVTVRVAVRADGKVEQAEVVRRGSDPAFDSAALLAARKELFVPEKHDGVPVATSLTYTYRFRISP